MKVTFLTQSKAQAALLELTKICESMEWAVAWATPNPLVEEALQYREKITRLVVGTHLYQTHPDVLEKFSSVRTARAFPPTGDLFHPKVYLFRIGNSVQAVIGSHNLTLAAMNKNIEASILIDGLSSEKALSELSLFIHEAWNSAQPLNPVFLDRYANQYRAKEGARNSLTTFFEYPLPRTKGTQRAPFELSWAAFVEQIEAPREPPLKDWLAVLDGVRSMFGKHESFAKMSADERKLVAGTAGKRSSIRDETDYQLFGSMGANGRFANVVLKAPNKLSEALNAIPSSGPVSKSDFEHFVSIFESAVMQDGDHQSGGTGTATRLLAMKRPDTFVCLNNANRRDLCEHFGVAPSTTRLENYWERIICQIMQTEWWQSPMPDHELQARIWRGRAALLDVIYYDRSVHETRKS